MRRLLIIKAGRKLPSLARTPGDFEDWMLAGMRWPAQDTMSVSVFKGESLPKLDAVCAAVVTGSAAMVTDHEDWIERSARWLADAVVSDMPVLGICFGHQLLAYALGGAVADNPRGLEVGTVPLTLTENAGSDPLFRHLGADAAVHNTHRQIVTRLPAGAECLARTQMDAYHAFRLRSHAWGVQFHPEFDAEISRAYVEFFRPELEGAGRDAESLRGACRDTAIGAQLLQAFAAVAANPR